MYRFSHFSRSQWSSTDFQCMKYNKVKDRLTAMEYVKDSLHRYEYQGVDVSALRSDIKFSRLVLNNITSPAPYNEAFTYKAFLLVCSTKKSHWERLGIPIRKTAWHPVVQSLLDEFEDMALARRKQEFIFRCISEFENRSGWFPLFDTLTVNPWHYRKVFTLGSTAFRQYVDRVQRAVAVQAYGSRKAWEEAGRPVVSTYCCVVEKGCKGRWHIHIQWFLQFLPEACRDMNQFYKQALRRECVGFKLFWRFGFSSPRPTRLGTNDSYGRLGWKWPHEKKNGRISAMKKLTPPQVACYIAKYLSKAYVTEDLLWKTRISRNFGLSRLMNVMTRLSDRNLKGLALGVASAPSVLCLTSQRTPKHLIRLLSTRHYLRRKRRRLLKFSKESSLLSYTMTMPSLPSFIQRWNDLIRGIPQSNLRSITSSQTRSFRTMDTYNVRIRDVHEAYDLLVSMF